MQITIGNTTYTLRLAYEARKCKKDSPQNIYQLNFRLGISPESSELSAIQNVEVLFDNLFLCPRFGARNVCSSKFVPLGDVILCQNFIYVNALGMKTPIKRNVYAKCNHSSTIITTFYWAHSCPIFQDNSIECTILCIFIRCKTVGEKIGQSCSICEMKWAQWHSGQRAGHKIECVT